MNPQISPDQVWAARRFLPITFPGFIVLGGLAQQRLTLPKFKQLSSWHAVSLVLATLALICISLTSMPFWSMRAFTQLYGITSMCSELQTNAVVVWVGKEGGFMTEPTENICHMPAISTTAKATGMLSMLSQLKQAAHQQYMNIYLAVNIQEAALVPAVGSPLHAITIRYTEPEHTYKKFPLHIITDTQTILLRRIHI